MKKTPAILLAIHVAAFALMLTGHISPGPVSNAVAAIGLTVEFPGWYLAALFMHSALPALAFCFFFNAFLYVSAGILVEQGTRRRS